VTDTQPETRPIPPPTGKLSPEYDVAQLMLEPAMQGVLHDGKTQVTVNICKFGGGLLVVIDNNPDRRFHINLLELGRAAIDISLWLESKPDEPAAQPAPAAPTTDGPPAATA
jgi:hypothetical protein